MKLLSWIAVCILIFSCSSPSPHEVENRDYNKEKVIDSFVASVNELWVKLFNSDSYPLDTLYHSQTIKVTEQGEVFQGIDLLLQENEKFKSSNAFIAYIYTDTIVIAGGENEYIYEIGGFITEDTTTYKHLIIWNFENEWITRELEFIVPSTSVAKIDSGVDSARQQWMKYCNAHDVRGLIEGVYTENTIYYNNGQQVVKGREELIEQYAYMNQADYNLTLTPIFSAPVNDHLVFEIGQCSGSYGGKYVIVWKKMETGNWQVLLDSNV